MNQTDLRQQILHKRRSLSADYQAAASQSVCQQLLQSKAYAQAQFIAAYLAVGREIDLHALIEQALQDNKHIYLPRLDGKQMTFAKYTHADRLVSNAFNIPEPATSCPNIQIEQLDLILLPLVAYDNHLNRIGMGGGYYDRALAPVKDKEQPIRIGVAYREQQIDACFANDWDIPLHQVISN